MGKMMLSLDDLHQYLKNKKKDVLFRASDKEKQNIIVQLNEPFVFELGDDYDADELKCKVHMKLCHTNINLNKSSIDKPVMEKAIPSAYNMPILGYIWKDEESGESYFAGHEMYKEDGETVYLESPVGVVSNNLELVYDEEAKVYRLEGDGYIWKNYTEAFDILNREKELSLSVELSIDELEYDAKKDLLVITEFHFSGVTILGRDIETYQEIKPGMAGSKITIADFSADNNSVFNENILNEIKKLNEKFESLQIEFSKKGESQVDKFNELLEKYNITSDQVEFDYEGLSDEELEAKFAEVFGADDSDNSEEAEAESAGEVTEVEGTSEENTDSTDSTEQVEPEADTENFALTLSDGTKNFSLSYSEIQYGLYNLFNAAHGDEDNWFCIENVYENNTAIFQNWFDNKYYRQSFEVNGDNVSLIGDAEEVFARFVNEAEKTALDMLQSNYDSAKEELDSYHAKENESQINDVLNSNVYEDVKETEEFSNLVENHAEFSVEDVKAKADEILLNFVKSQKTNTEEKTTVNFSVKEITETKETKKKSRYGGLFKSSK